MSNDEKLNSEYSHMTERYLKIVCAHTVNMKNSLYTMSLNLKNYRHTYVCVCVYV